MVAVVMLTHFNKNCTDQNKNYANNNKLIINFQNLTTLKGRFSNL